MPSSFKVTILSIHRKRAIRLTALTLIRSFDAKA